MSVKQIIAYALEGNHIKLSEALDAEMEDRIRSVMKDLYTEEAHSLFEDEDEDDDEDDMDDEDEDEEDEDEELEEKAPKKMKYSKKK